MKQWKYIMKCGDIITIDFEGDMPNSQVIALLRKLGYITVFKR